VGALGYFKPSSDSTVPVKVNLDDVISLSATGDFTCALLANGDVSCWGKPSWSSSTLFNPTTFMSVPDGKSIQVGAGEVCVILNDHSMECLDQQYSYKIQNKLNNINDISFGARHSCTVLQNGLAQCWGQNDYGQVGDGSYTSTGDPTTVTNLSNVKSIEVGAFFTCALLTDGTIQCWGKHKDYRQLGNPSPNDSIYPVKVPGITNAIDIGVGSNHTCALLADGTSKCWGQSITGVKQLN